MWIGNRASSCKKSNQLFYIVDWLPPDFGAVGQYGAIFARDRAVAGRDVRLIGLSTGEHSTTREVLPNGKIFEITRIRSSFYCRIKIDHKAVMDIPKQYTNCVRGNPRL